jgi:hypothetical protein
MSTVPLGGVLGALNHLVAAILEEYAANTARAAFSLDSISIDEQSLRVSGTFRRQDAVDRIVVRLDVSPPLASRQNLKVSVEQWPVQLPPLILWLKPLLDHADIAVNLDFEPWPPPSAGT